MGAESTRLSASQHAFLARLGLSEAELSPDLVLIALSPPGSPTWQANEDRFQALVRLGAQATLFQATEYLYLKYPKLPLRDFQNAVALYTDTAAMNRMARVYGVQHAVNWQPSPLLSVRTSRTGRPSSLKQASETEREHAHERYRQSLLAMFGVIIIAKGLHSPLLASMLATHLLEHRLVEKSVLFPCSPASAPAPVPAARSSPLRPDDKPRVTSGHVEAANNEERANSLRQTEHGDKQDHDPALRSPAGRHPKPWLYALVRRLTVPPNGPSTHPETGPVGSVPVYRLEGETGRQSNDPMYLVGVYTSGPAGEAQKLGESFGPSLAIAENRVRLRDHDR